MKPTKLFLLMAIISVGAFLGACNNGRGRGLNTGANMGATPTPSCLLSPNGVGSQCNFNYGSYSGFSNYQYTLYVNGLNNNYSGGFCGCGQSGFPVYSNNWGLGCVDSASLQQASYGYNNVGFLMFTWNAQALNWTTASPNYWMGNYGSNNSCLNTVILTCDTGIQGSCGPNGTCISFNTYGGSGYMQRSPGLCIINQNGQYRGY